MNDDDHELRLLGKVLEKNLLTLAYRLVFPFPLPHQELTPALKNHVDVAGVSLGVACNHSLELEEVNVRGIGVVHQFV